MSRNIALLSKLAFGAALAAATLAPLQLSVAGPIASNQCRTFGTAPFCAGHCPSSGFSVFSHSTGVGCITGKKAVCCTPATIGGAQGGNLCDNYVRDAVQAANDNIRLHCGFTGPRWTLDANAHRSFCQGNLNVGNTHIIAVENSARNQGINSCTPNGGPVVK